MLSRFGDTTNAAVAERTVKDCLILPPPAADLPAIAKLADFAAAAGPEHKAWLYIQFAKGLAEFRQGRFRAALDWLEPLLDKTTDQYRAVQTHMTAAMAQYRLQQPEQARSTLAKGLEIADLRLARFTAESGPEERANDWIIAQALMREARALIGMDPAKNASNKP